MSPASRRAFCRTARPPAPITRRSALWLEALEDRLVPDGRPLPLPVIYIGTGEGPPPLVRAFDAETGALNFERLAADPAFTGGVRVGTADITRDGYPDLVTALGPGGPPRVRVLDGKTGDPVPGPLGDFMAYAPEFAGGVQVAAADVDGDTIPDVITGAGAGGGPHVKAFSGATGEEIRSFFAFEEDFAGGVSLAAADLTGDGRADLAVGAGPGGGPRVRVFDMATGAPIAGPLGDFFAFDPATRSGANVGTDALAADADADGTPDLAVGTGPGAASLIRVFSGATGGVLRELAPFGPGMTAGVRVALNYSDDDQYADIVVGTGPGPAATVRVFSGLTGQPVALPTAEFAPFGPDAIGGVNLAASNDPPVVMVTASFNAVEPTVPGGCRTIGKFVIAAGETPPTPYTITYTLEGTATSGVDYVAPTGKIAVAAGGQFEVPIDPLYDTVFDPNETVTLKLSAGAGYTVGSPNTATLLIADPPLSLDVTVGSKFIPVNANNDNGSTPWKSDDLPFIPKKRDFAATNLPVDDPQLVPVTATIGGGAAGTLSVSAFAPGDAQVAFWADKRKQAAFSSKAVAASATPVAVTFYVEGTHESSSSLNDVRIDLTFTTTATNPQQTVERSNTVMVTPFFPTINSFTSTIPTPSVNFYKQRPVDGLEGLVAANPPAVAGEWTAGIAFDAQITNGPLTMKYVQNFRNLQNGANGSGAGAVFTTASGLANQNYLPTVASKYTYPGLDSTNPADPTAVSEFSSTATANGVTIHMEDSPQTGVPAEADKLDKLDMKYLLRLYVVVQYADQSLYPIAYWDWNVNFFATTNVAGKGVSVIAAASKVGVEGGWVKSNADPLKTKGPTFNTSVNWP
ncbi:MAG: hypothetical protein K2X82_17960 [Gemmataceae bacterium]|nr:hypothetical protein [Gemmataceae bacterium]